MWNLAIKTLLADPGKLGTALLGLTFTLVLVNIQGGLFIGLIRKVSLMVDNGDAHIWVGHRGMHNVDFAEDIPRWWVERIRGLPGVELAAPYLIGWSSMTLPNGSREAVVVVGTEPPALLGNAWRVRVGRAEDVIQPDAIIVDLMERPKLLWPRLGEVREIGGHRARIVAFSEGVMGFLVAPYVFTTIDRAARYCQKDPQFCSYLLVRARPGTDLEKLCAEIRARIPEADAYVRDDYSALSVDFWMRRTGLGISFGAATALGMLVGLVIVAQTMYAAVLDRMPEYAALKAMGATGRHLLVILQCQALFLATVAATLGMLAVFCVQWLYSTPRAPIWIPWWLSSGSCALAWLIASASAALPYRRLRAADPMAALT